MVSSIFRVPTQTGCGKGVGPTGALHCTRVCNHPGPCEATKSSDQICDEEGIRRAKEFWVKGRAVEFYRKGSLVHWETGMFLSEIESLEVGRTYIVQSYQEDLKGEEFLFLEGIPVGVSCRHFCAVGDDFPHVEKKPDENIIRASRFELLEVMP